MAFDASKAATFIRRRWRLCGAVILLVHLLLMAGFALRNSATFDEPVYIAGGVGILKAGSYVLNIGNGVFTQVWPALPLFEVPFPLEKLAADTYGNSFSVDALSAGGLDFDSILFRARMMNTLLSVGCGWLLLLVARRMAGTSAALLALCLYAVFPVFVSNGALATAEIATTLFFFASAWTCDLAMRRLNIWTFLLFSASLSLLALSKMSAPLMAFVALGIAVAAVLLKRPLRLRLPWGRERRIVSRTGKGVAFALLLFAAGLATAFSIWAAYGFRQGMPELLAAAGRSVAGEKALGLTGRAAELLSSAKLLPDAYLFAIAGTSNSNSSRWSYLNGKISATGHHLFFQKVFLMKTPPEIIVLFFISPFAIALAWRRGKRRLAVFMPFGILMAAYLAAAFSINLNIGYRHLMPALLPLLLLCALSLRLLLSLKSRSCHAVAVLLVALCVFDSMRCYPGSLAFFSSFYGGPDKAYLHIGDSSLDWGQDLKNLKTSLARRGIPLDGSVPIYFSYFGVLPAEGGGFNCVTIPHQPPRDLTEFKALLSYDFKPGYYCFSANMLQGMGSVYPEISEILKSERENECMAVLNRCMKLNASEEGLPKELAEDRAVSSVCYAMQTIRMDFIRQCLMRSDPLFTVNGSIIVFKVDEHLLTQALASEVDLRCR